MSRRLAVAVAVVLAVNGVPVAAEKIKDDFKAAFEQRFRKGMTHAVVMQDGLPTTSTMGIDGKQQDAHYSIDVLDGRWKPAEGLLDFNQLAADSLQKGEVMELTSISYKDNRIELRFVSGEAHKLTRDLLDNNKLTRGDGLIKSRKPEPVATYFKFFLPFPKTKVLAPGDLPAVVEYIEAYLKIFPGEKEAKAYAARLIAGGAEPARATAPTAGKASSKEIKAGMTPLEVIEILGKPQKEFTFENLTRWTYPDLTVFFENGRVKEVKF